MISSQQINVYDGHHLCLVSSRLSVSEVFDGWRKKDLLYGYKKRYKGHSAPLPRDYMLAFLDAHSKRATGASAISCLRTPLDLKDTFNTLMFQWLPDTVGMGTSVLH